MKPLLITALILACLALPLLLAHMDRKPARFDAQGRLRVGLHNYKGRR